MINTFKDFIIALNQPKPLSIIRLGNVEASQMLCEAGELYYQMPTNAGFFGDDKALMTWKKDMLFAMKNADLNMRVVSCNSFWVCDDVLTRLNLFIPTLPYVEDITFWTSLLNQLNTNKLAFVSYFSEDIKKQIPFMKWILEKNGGINKDAKKWKIIHSLNTIEGNQPSDKSFKEVGEELLKRCLDADQDIYFLSCGCYGIPLCDALKRKGKKAIYVGGFLQLLFGLKGKRWDDRNIVSQFYNKHWKYPETKPENHKLVEGGCYWGEEVNTP